MGPSIAQFINQLGEGPGNKVVVVFTSQMEKITLWAIVGLALSNWANRESFTSLPESTVLHACLLPLSSVRVRGIHSIGIEDIDDLRIEPVLYMCKCNQLGVCVTMQKWFCQQCCLHKTVSSQMEKITLGLALTGHHSCTAMHSKSHLPLFLSEHCAARLLSFLRSCKGNSLYRSLVHVYNN